MTSGNHRKKAAADDKCGNMQLREKRRKRCNREYRGRKYNLEKNARKHEEKRGKLTTGRKRGEAFIWEQARESRLGLSRNIIACCTILVK